MPLLPNSCFFIGHRDMPDSVYSALLQMIETVIAENSISDFYVGNHGSFDALAARAVIETRQGHPDIRLHLVLPHPRRFLPLPAGFDDAFYPPDIPRSRYAIIHANRFMVDHVNCLIACTFRPYSNSSRILDYARRRQARGEMRVENLLQDMIDWAKKDARAEAGSFRQDK